MAQIEGIRIKNFKVLKDITLGKVYSSLEAKPLQPLTVVIGKNGVGKSTLFDAFGFIADCLSLGVEEACDARGRGGFDRLLTKSGSGFIEFEVYYREDKDSRPITYELTIGKDNHGRPYVQKERLRQRRKRQSTGRPFSFLILEEGRGVVWKGEQEGVKEDGTADLSRLLERIKDAPTSEEGKETEVIELEDQRKLGIATLGALKQHPRIAKFRRFIEGWYLSYFAPDAARSLPLAGPQRHLSIHGDNLANVVQYMEREHSETFNRILERIASKIPGVQRIDTQRTDDGRLLLRFNDRGFSSPFYAQQMSDGTLKMFSYLLLLEDPSPPPFICIEEPENGLYHKLLEGLAREIREHATGRKGTSQVFVTTHQPYFVDALDPSEVWVLEKGTDGFARIKRADEFPIVDNLVKEEIPLGSLWYSNYLDPV
ncbi:MAG: ATPase [Ectothiorhodospiraceae bacterium]|nr:ATPase [Ectothiorhodospiraceae bacterium]